MRKLAEYTIGVLMIDLSRQGCYMITNMTNIFLFFKAFNLLFFFSIFQGSIIVHRYYRYDETSSVNARCNNNKRSAEDDQILGSNSLRMIYLH